MASCLDLIPAGIITPTQRRFPRNALDKRFAMRVVGDNFS